MQNEIIKAPKGAKYLSEFMTSLPVNCLFNKGITGCGGTDLALKNNIDTIIAMPYVSLIKNKKSQHGDRILGVYGDTETEEIVSYMRRRGKKKIAVTYDSLGRLVSVLEEMGIDVFNHFFLLVDEWHVLFNSYVFRNKAIKRLLELAKLFKEVTYMSATPIEDEFILEELKCIPVIKVDWPDVKKVMVKPIKTNNPLSVVTKLVADIQEGRAFGNLHIFVNSVKFIEKVLFLRPSDQVRVICSKNNNKGRFMDYSFTPADTTDPVQRINFYTSTCFEGCDIYDPEGKTIIVSDGRKAHTLMDISTLFVQICGRIRDSLYNGEVTHVFSETKYDHVISLEEYKRKSKEQEVETQIFIDEINNMSENSRKRILGMIKRDDKGSLNDRYIFFKDNKLIFDKNLVKLDILNFKLCRYMYNSCLHLLDVYAQNGFETDNLKQVLCSDKLAANENARIPFKDLFLEYSQIRDAKKGLIYFGNREERQVVIERKRPLVKDAYEILGGDFVKFLNYNVTRVRRELLKQSEKPIDGKIYQYLKDLNIKEGVSLPTYLLKQTLQKVYTVCGKKTNAKASDIGKWFDFERRTKKINGKSVEFIELLKEKFVYE